MTELPYALYAITINFMVLNLVYSLAIYLTWVFKTTTNELFEFIR